MEPNLTRTESRFYEDARTVGLLLLPNYEVNNNTFSFRVKHRHVLINCDDSAYHSSMPDMIRDNVTDHRANAEGFEVVRIRDTDIFPYGEVVARVVKEITASEDKPRPAKVRRAIKEAIERYKRMSI